MSSILRRRHLLVSLLLPSVHALAESEKRDDGFEREIRLIEQRSGGRLGVTVRRLGGSELASYRGDERFPLCSTFKVLAASRVLQRVDRLEESLSRRIPFARNDLVVNSPITSARVDEGAMTLGELCAAAITRSDNTAANLILKTFGGPAALTAFARSLGDEVTRLVRIEPSLNEAARGDDRDTTSPRAMGRSLDEILAGTVLTSEGKAQLVRWLAANETGARRLRALLPDGWRVGDKTGTGDNGTANDVGILWPPTNAAPLLVCCYLTGSTASSDAQNDAIAAVGLRCSRLVSGA